MSAFFMGSSLLDAMGPNLSKIEQLGGGVSSQGSGPRGYSVYSVSQLMGVSAKDKDGGYEHVQYQQPTFALDPITRIELFKFCSPLFGVITSRMNRISALDIKITPDSKDEDKIVRRLKNLKSLHDEYPLDSFYAVGVRLQCVKEIRCEIPEILPDLSNFDRAMYRWSRNIKITKQDVADEIHDWLMRPNQDQEWVDFIKAWVGDLLIHGAGVVYKEAMGGRIENLYVLPGGTVLPIQEGHVGGVSGYVQAMMTLDPILMMQDEVVYASYVPSSSTKYGHVPIDALVNKIAESLMFDRLMAEQADGTKPPEKILIFGEQTPFADFKGMENFNMPLRKDEQQRIEHVVNEARMNAVRVLSGLGQPFMLDLSRENTMGTQMQRQEAILKDIALVFNMSNMEINLSGGDGTSGRNTSDAQADIENAKGTRPITKLLESRINRQILPFRYGPGYKLEFIADQSEEEHYRVLASKMATGLYDVNAIRISEGEDPYNDPKYDFPQGASGQEAQQQPGQQTQPPPPQAEEDPLAGLFG